MILKDVLSTDRVCLNLAADNKEGVIREMLDILQASGTVNDRAMAESDVMKREAELSTGLSNGIAFPHAKTSAVDQLSVAIALKPGGLDFEALDGKPSEVFILSLIPADANAQYLSFLAAVNMRLTDPAVRERLIGAKKAPEVVKLLAADPN